MNIKRIMAFGCSITYGEGLIDCLDSNNMRPPYPSEYAWPACLGKTFDCPVQNLGHPGTSNKNICNQILQQRYKKDDVAIILWTDFARTTFYTDETRWIDIQPSSTLLQKPWKRKIAKSFYKTLYFDINQNIESYSAINFAKLYLDEKGVKNYHFIWAELPFNNTKEPDWNKVNIRYINLYQDHNPNYIFIDYASDDLHPGIKTQNLIADTMSNIILND
tara:strand:- start:294 stop:950 length:657 start_codon:yes stop_codon:yes gene_type:complete